MCAVRAALAARLAWRPRLVGLWFLDLVLDDLALLVFLGALEVDLLPLVPEMLPAPLFDLLAAVFFFVDEDRAEGAFESSEVCPATGDKTISNASRPASRPPARRELYRGDEIALILQLYDESALFDGSEPPPLPHCPTSFGLIRQAHIHNPGLVPGPAVNYTLLLAAC